MNELREIAQFLPFLTLANNNAKVAGAAVWKHPLTVRLLEAVIIGALAMYGSVRGLEQELRYVKTEITRVSGQVEKIDGNLRKIEQEQWRINALKGVRP